MSGSPFMFDRKAFADVLNAVRRVERGLSMDQAAIVVGVTKAQLFRAEHQRPINIEAFLIICRWMDVEPSTFLVSRGVVGETSEAAQSLTEAAA